VSSHTDGSGSGVFVSSGAEVLGAGDVGVAVEVAVLDCDASGSAVLVAVALGVAVGVLDAEADGDAVVVPVCVFSGVFSPVDALDEVDGDWVSA
jgi:hypothetical protein